MYGLVLASDDGAGVPTACGGGWTVLVYVRLPGGRKVTVLVYVAFRENKKKRKLFCLFF